jgi:hypothetical protein
VSSREDATTKGPRYLVERRLTIAFLDDRVIEAVCLGDSGEYYRLGFGAAAGGAYVHRRFAVAI